MELTDEDKRVLDERNFPEKIKKMIEDMPKDDIMRIHDFAEYVLIKERVSKTDKKSSAKLTDKEISEIAEEGSFDGKMAERIDYAKETDYLIANYKWKRDNGLNEKKYELTGETIKRYGHTLHRIKALKDFGTLKNKVRKGEYGGFIEKEDNLSQEGNCWIRDNALVYGNARVYENARVFGNTRVYGSAKVFGDVWVCGYASVYDDAKVHDRAIVYDKAKVYDNAEVSGNALVYDNARVYGSAELYDDAQVYDNALVYENAKVYGNTEVYGEAGITDNAKVYGNAKVTGRTVVEGNAEISEGKISNGA